MSKTKHRVIFEADYSSADIAVPNIFEIEKEYCHIITDDQYIMSKHQKRVPELIKFISSCIYLAKSARTEISIDVTEESQQLTVFLAAKVICFNIADLINLSSICLSAINLVILSGDEQSDNALICIDYNLSDNKLSMIDRFSE